MIEKIFIPTVNRPNNQITYDNLPPALQERVVFVVQAWEADQYKHYGRELLVLPDTPEFHLSDYYCLPKTRLEIYRAGRKIKYAMLDDDLTFKRRTSRNYGVEDGMEKSRRDCTPADMIEMFDTFDKWLDEESVTFCGCSTLQTIPGNERWTSNTNVASAFFINGLDFDKELDSFDLTRVKIAEDACFVLTLLTRGYGNRRSETFVYDNQSWAVPDMASTIWDEQGFQQTWNDHKILESMFPGIVSIPYDNDGNRIPGGLRNFGKLEIKWTKAFKSKNKYHKSTIHNSDLFEF